ncbi:hypothetical protein ADICYQ_3848 [Cyclobacterium qasimii M12-11B]|uniref:Uncharacterized protein n=1 Tax=Cyclobacterium qasimii M12-11B TaxID=641524 RepID=S7WKA2_9BACT|nr:hypothetical protein ADICYQ_3848 [Cyclobacterium qasimii M12-11B]
MPTIKSCPKMPIKEKLMILKSGWKSAFFILRVFWVYYVLNFMFLERVK